MNCTQTTNNSYRLELVRNVQKEMKKTKQTKQNDFLIGRGYSDHNNQLAQNIFKYMIFRQILYQKTIHY